jgi:hypothetical protein
LLQWSKLHYSILSLSKEMMNMPHHLSKAYFHREGIFKLVPRWGKCISMFVGYDEKWWYFGGISELHWMLWWLVIWCSGTMKPYLLHIPCRFQKHLTAVVQKLWTHKKQYKIWLTNSPVFLCNRMWIYQGMN